MSSYTEPKKGNNRYDINTLLNDHTKSVGRDKIPAMYLAERYKPVTNQQMREIITKHAPWKLEECAEQAFMTQQFYDCDYTYEELLGFIENLMVDKTLIGNRKEKQALDYLQGVFPQFRFDRATGHEDSSFAVDIIIRDNVGIVGAIQVKPDTHRTSTREAIIKSRASNAMRNASFIKQNPRVQRVVYLYYDREKRFMDVPQFVLDLLVLLPNCN